MTTDVNEYFYRDTFSLEDWEMFLSVGWDRIGDYFFHRRYDFSQIPFLPDGMYFRSQLLPLRYNLNQKFTFSKSQRIILKRNEDLRRVYQHTQITAEKLDLFQRWYAFRFKKEASLATWVSNEGKPFPTYEVCFYKGEKLVACSFFDLMKRSQYSTTAMFDPDEKHRSLGTLTLLGEIEFGLLHNKKYHYPGHAYLNSSMYDYKKRFNNMEGWDWDLQEWVPVARLI
jgi:leucyl-tRNA---protein transferase